MKLDLPLCVSFDNLEMAHLPDFYLHVQFFAKCLKEKQMRGKKHSLPFQRIPDQEL